MKKTTKELLQLLQTPPLQRIEGPPPSSQISSSDLSPPLSHQIKNQYRPSKIIRPKDIQPREAHIISFPSAPVQDTEGTEKETILQRTQLGEITAQDTGTTRTTSEPHCGPFQFQPESETPLSNAQHEEAFPADPLTPLVRSYDCKHYDCCLELAAALNWENFTCSGCGGDINQHLVWKANLAKREDEVANRLCKKTRIRFA
ncbi:MAG: hypothetical protein ACO3XO_02025 [Bdellovibrionota bacterium]